MEYHTCKICNETKLLTLFPKNRFMKIGRENVCKLCRKLGLIIEKKKPQTKKEFDWFKEFKLTCPRKQDYQKMYEFLSQIGYNLDKDIHQQFCDKHNLRYRRRVKKAESQYLPNGEINSESRAEKLKRNI